MKPFGPGELNEDVRSRELCVECGACIGNCQYVKTYRGKSTMLFNCDAKEGRCFSSCPKTETDLNRLSQTFFGRPYDESPIGFYRKIFISKAEDYKDKNKFQNGGTVTALISYAMDKGLIDAAALTDRSSDMVPVPRLATTIDDVKGCSTSKYMASPSLSSYNIGAKEGYGRIGVVGTPCQLTALAKIRSNPHEFHDFKDSCGITIGLFCTWALDARRFRAFLSDRYDLKSIKYMDISPPPEEKMHLITEEGKTEIPLSEIRPYIPKGCSICPDMTSELSDISVGAFEGMPGFNTLIIRTEKGEELVENAVRDGALKLDVYPDEALHKLSEASNGKRRKAFRDAKSQNLLNNCEEGKRSALIVPAGVVNRILTTEKEAACQI